VEPAHRQAHYVVKAPVDLLHGCVAEPVLDTIAACFIERLIMADIMPDLLIA
jgi:hypothetical protein